jgi:uracil phosphoribosyltransferase/phosphoserine phosphatase
VGIYGIPGSGKTFLLNQLKQKLGEERYEFYEGSNMISSLVPGGLAAFQKLDDNEKLNLRQRAIDMIGKDCSRKGRTGVVAGHFMFWPEEDPDGHRVYTSNDLDTFTHILYLNTPIDLVEQRHLNDNQKLRSPASIDHLHRWQQAEKTELRGLCRQHGILFSLVSSTPSMLLEKITSLLNDFRDHTEKVNLRRAESRLDNIIAAFGVQARLETVLVMDADKTLTSQDTGKVFWETLAHPQNLTDNDDPLKAVFSSKLGYSYTAFRQATLLYEEEADDHEFDVVCEKVASMVSMHPEFTLLLRQVAEEDHIAAVIITCGLRHVWNKILAREGLSEKVKVIGGGRIADGFVVTASVKAALVSRIRVVHNMYVFAFGDSPLDLGMLRKAHEAVVVVGEEPIRSKSMEKALQIAIDEGRLRARQVLLPPHASPRLDTEKLPLVQINQEFIQLILRQRQPIRRFRIVVATNRSAAKLLMTPMRDAGVAGPALRAAHGNVGWYLASEFVTDMIGLEEYAIPHVQGHQTNGHRLHHEQQTAIVALMRGGEPMALGVSSAFPLAMLVHATKPSDVKFHHLQKRDNVLLVDSVINSGKSVVEFIQHIRSLGFATIRIIVVAGTVQAKSLSEGPFSQTLEQDVNLSLVALRVSDNKFTGSGSTDTGNRLFNTTHIT